MKYSSLLMAAAITVGPAIAQAQSNSSPATSAAQSSVDMNRSGGIRSGSNHASDTVNCPGDPTSGRLSATRNAGTAKGNGVNCSQMARSNSSLRNEKSSTADSAASPKRNGAGR